MVDPEAPPEYVFYHYHPSLSAAVVFIVIFTFSTIYHMYLLFRRRTWFFIPFVIGGTFECVGYAGRVISSQESPDWTLAPYVMQSLLLLLGPALFAASIYMILGRIILLTDGESCSIIKAKWLTKIFVGGDILSFLAQSTGGGLLAKATSREDVKLGENIIVAGLFIQAGFFGLFLITAGLFHYRISQFPTIRSSSTGLPWKRHLYVLYIASLLITVRNTFRIVEYIMGSDGVLLTNEVYLYVFDAALMAITTVLFNIWHPGSIISKRFCRGARELESQASEHMMVSQKSPAY
ncbi:hypothetical protein FQN57_004749 [Myotisia sp. PD_48]|nr:hypothetical protein FQN57_004749 [Myotisia sp. PD_48]